MELNPISLWLVLNLQWGWSDAKHQQNDVVMTLYKQMLNAPGTGMIEEERVCLLKQFGRALLNKVCSDVWFLNMIIETVDWPLLLQHLPDNIVLYQVSVGNA